MSSQNTPNLTLNRPGVSAETLQAEGIRHLTAKEANELFDQFVACWWIPYYHADKTPVLCNPVIEVNGKSVTLPEIVFGRGRKDHAPDGNKYTQAGGVGAHGYIPRCFKPVKGGILYIPEGEFKTLSMIEAGYCAAGAGGINNCAVLGGGALAPELAEAIAVCQPKAVAFVGDADTSLIPAFSNAMLQLARLIHPVPLLLPRLPVNAPGKGIDDCRAVLKDQFNAWFDALVSQSVTVSPNYPTGDTPKARRKAAQSPEARRMRSTLALELLHREVEALKTLTDTTAVTRDNALKRSLQLAAGFFEDVPTRDEIIRVTSDVFGLPVAELLQQAEQTHIEQKQKWKEEWAAKHGKRVFVPAPVPAVPALTAGDKLPPIESLDELVNDPTATTPPEIIQGLIHQGSKIVIAGNSKIGKSWLLQHLALAVSTGSPFWGLPTVQGRVLYLNFEIQRPFLKRRFLKLTAATGITEHGNVDTWNLRGYSTHLGILMPKIIERVKERGYTMIIIDPIYKGLGGRDENNAGAMGELCNELEALAVQTEAAVVFAAHFSKGNQALKAAIDRISGSGVIARDADAIITLTAHDTPNAYTVEATLRNFPPLEPFVVEWNSPLMVRRPDLNPAQLKQVGGRKPSYTTADILPLLKAGPLTTTEWLKLAEKQAGLSKSTFLRLMKAAVKSVAVIGTADDKWTLPAATPQGVTSATSANSTN
jgi:hypothetical protein